MRTIKTFDAFGVQYRSKQFAATVGLAMMNMESDVHPCEMLGLTEVKTQDGRWLPLSDPDNVNLHLKDIAGVIAPRLVLDGILSIVRDLNFGFLKAWRSARVPSRFISDSKFASNNHTDPIIAQLFQDDAASPMELETYYSLEDAFKMFDLLVVKGINQAIANEASTKKLPKR